MIICVSFGVRYPCEFCKILINRSRLPYSSMIVVRKLHSLTYILSYSYICSYYFIELQFGRNSSIAHRIFLQMHDYFLV